MQNLTYLYNHGHVKDNKKALNPSFLELNNGDSDFFSKNFEICWLILVVKLSDDPGNRSVQCSA